MHFRISTWINGATYDSSQRIPCPVIKPVVKFVKSFLSQKAGGSVVKISVGGRGVVSENGIMTLPLHLKNKFLTGRTHG